MAEVCIKIFEDRDEAELFRCFLEDQGIESYIKVDECGGCCESDCSDGVKLIVDERDRQEALKVIEEACQEDEYE